MFYFSILGGNMNNAIQEEIHEYFRYNNPIDYPDLLNKPSINGVELVGDKKDTDLDLQHKLDYQQLQAVNSGINYLKVQAYDNLDKTKQNKLDDVQLQVLQSGITAAKLKSIFNFQFLKELEGYESGKTQVLKNVNGSLKWVTENG